MLTLAKKREKRNKDVRAWHAREIKRMAREEAARLAALRSNDYEEYLRLARHTKDKRLKQLLDKTDDIMRELGLKVWMPSCGVCNVCVCVSWHMV